MNNNKSLPVPNPDFDSLKQSLKEFMKQYDGLSDYDFDGSTLSIWLDTLSYNSHLNAFWLNMIANEANLKTALKRHNVVAAARDLGYVPNSAKSASTELYLEYTSKDPIQTSITIPAGTTFTSSTNTAAYTFNIIDDTSAEYNYSRGVYIVESVKIHEGRLLVHEWDVVAEKTLGIPNTIKDVTIEGASIPNLDVDTSLLKVYVLDTKLGAEWINFKPYDNGLDISKDSNVYFLSEDELGLANVAFGDGILGFKPSIGSKIKIVYLVSSGQGANGIGTFNQSSTLSGNTTITTLIPRYVAAGGAYAEDINSIKFNAQLSYESQGKAVVTGDYEYLVKRAYPNAKKVITWGGQDNDPPQFGKVFLSIQPVDGLTLTTKEKYEIIDSISKKNITTITPIVVEPEDIYIDLNVNLNYIPDNNISSGALERIVIDNINGYAYDTLNTFNKNLEYSRLLSNIDNSSKYITSNITEVVLSKRLNIYNNKQKEFNLDFGNAIIENKITSSSFSYSSYDNCYFESVGTKLQVVTTIMENQKERKIVIVSDAGTIDYSKGTIRLKVITVNPSKLYFDDIKNNFYIKVFGVPLSNNVKASRNQILHIDNIKVFQKKVL